MLRILLLLSFALSAFAQSDDELRAVVILARHGVRAPIESETRSSAFNAQPWPTWPVEPGTLTPHGIEALKRMGEFYKQRYGGLITSCHSVLAQSTNTPRTIASAGVMVRILLANQPHCDAHTIELGLTTDPATMDKTKNADAINGRMANQPEWFTHTFARPLEEMHDVLTKCTGCKAVPDFRTSMLDAGAAQPSMTQSTPPAAKTKVVPRDARKENAVALGADFAENFLLEYVEGMPMSNVGWGRVSRAKLDELMEMNTRYHDFILRTPYYAEQAAGPLAQKIATFLQWPASSSRVLYLSAHDANLTWMGGLLRINWLISDETFNATPPGSALVFELHHNNQTNADTVQVFFIAQTLDQIRNLTSLTGDDKPSIAPIYIPNCSGPAPNYACTLQGFAHAVAAVSP